MALDVDHKAWASVDVLRFRSTSKAQSHARSHRNNRQDSKLQTISKASEVQAANERGTANERVARDVAKNLGQSGRKPAPADEPCQVIHSKPVVRLKKSHMRALLIDESRS